MGAESRRISAGAVGAIALLAVSAAAQAPEQPERFWRQDSAYAGALKCAGCHAALYSQQEASNHARSLRVPAEIDELVQPLPFRYRDRGSGAELTLARTTSGALELTASKGQETHRVELSWAFGSGVKGITPIGTMAHGAAVESRLSWYAAGHAFGLTTGASQREPITVIESLGRSLTGKEVRECFSCHTTGYTPDQPAPDRREMGIRCERCHGPALEHARLMQNIGGGPDLKIFHPGKVDAFSQVRLCGACHGRPPRDTDLQAIRAIELRPNTVRFPSQRLVLSRCYNESIDNLKCTHCHDPHANVSAQRERQDQACLACHGKESRPPAASCPKAVAGCVSCHMPKEKVMVHSQFTDHWIRVIRAGSRLGG